jgi:hypothetical protein
MKRIIIVLLFFAGLSLGQSLSYIGEIGEFQRATAFSINPKGFIFVTDGDRNEIIKMDTAGTMIRSIGGYGWGITAFDEPVDVFSWTLNVYVTDKNNHRIQIFDKDLNFLSEFTTRSYEDQTYAFAYPTASATSGPGDLFVLDSDNNRILKYNLTGEFLQEIGSYDAGAFALSKPIKFVISPDTRLFVIDHEEIFVFDQFGNGLNKLNPGLAPTNINITFDNLTINDERKIKFVNLSRPNSPIVTFKVPIELRDGLIVETIIFNQKLYVLTESNIRIFKIN